MMSKSRAVFVPLACILLPVSLACLGGKGFSDEQEVCDAYLDCLEEMFPDQVDVARATYGDDSACWEDSDAAEACAQGCQSAADALGDCTLPGNGGGNGGGNCMGSTHPSGFPDIFPESGPPSGGGDEAYAACETYTGDLLIVYAPEAQCNSSGWTYTMEHYGSSHSAELYLSSRSWAEAHPISTGTSGPNGWYERYDLSLSLVSSPGQVQAGQSTSFTCAPSGAPSVFAYEVTSSSGQVLDCVILAIDSASDALDNFDRDFPHMVSCDVVYGWIVSP